MTIKTETEKKDIPVVRLSYNSHLYPDFKPYVYKSTFLFQTIEKAGKEQGIYIRTIFPYLNKTGVVTTSGEVFLARTDNKGFISFLPVEEAVFLVTRQVFLEMLGENL